MGDPLQELEEQLERMVPRGLSEQGRGRLEDQIDELAAVVEAAPGSWQWQKLAAIAAALALVATMGFMIGGGGPGGRTTGPEITSPEKTSQHVPGFEMVGFDREVLDNPEHLIVLSRHDEPMHKWGYKTREIELVLDEESGLRVRIVSEHDEVVLTAVTSF